MRRMLLEYKRHSRAWSIVIISSLAAIPLALDASVANSTVDAVMAILMASIAVTISAYQILVVQRRQRR